MKISSRVRGMASSSRGDRACIRCRTSSRLPRTMSVSYTHLDVYKRQVSMFDDEIMEMYLEGKDIPTDKIRAAIRKATVAVEMVPVTCKNKIPV